MIQPLPTRIAAPRPQTGVRRPRILIAEDDDEMRRLLANSLAPVSNDIVEAQDGAQLVEHLADALRTKTPVDLVITDLRMPTLGGFEAIEWFRTLGCRAPVIAITAFGDRRTHLEAVRLGVVRVFEKPFDLTDLTRLVRDLFTPRTGRGGQP